MRILKQLLVDLIEMIHRHAGEQMMDQMIAVVAREQYETDDRINDDISRLFEFIVGFQNTAVVNTIGPVVQRRIYPDERKHDQQQRRERIDKR